MNTCKTHGFVTVSVYSLVSYDYTYFYRLYMAEIRRKQHQTISPSIRNIFILQNALMVIMERIVPMNAILQTTGLCVKNRVTV